MKLYFENAEALNDGILEVAPELGIELTGEEEAQIRVTVKAVEERMLCVSLKGNVATVTYGDGYARFFRALAILAAAIRRGDEELQALERPIFASNGAMVDMSRNAVMNTASVKAMLRKMALMGLNTYQLYTEDTYTLEDYPYFGHMRGRYTCEELCELDRYAQMLGIELIPCIQVLGHLATHLSWAASAGYKDTANVLLVGEEKTYLLIEAMIQTVSKCFTTRRVHIGMDEAGDLGLGKYLSRFGYQEAEKIFFAHLERVSEILAKYGMQAMMWSDMFFRLAGKEIPGYEDYHPGVTFDQAFLSRVPKQITQVYWDYYHEDEGFYAANIDQHRQLSGENMVFAGGVWLWSGHCPLYSESLRNSVPALEACRKKGVKEVFATVWLNGAESFQLLSMAGLAWYADYDYKGRFDLESVKHCFFCSCGVDYDTLIQCELPEHPHGERYSVTRTLLYNDPLLGLFDRHFTGVELDGYYGDVTRSLNRLPADCGIFSPAIDVIRKLSEVLEHKASFGIRLKAAYDRGDREALAAMGEECDTVLEKLAALRQAHRAAWMHYNKPFGWEVHDLRYGGLQARFDTVRECIGAYLTGDLPRIAELEEARLPFDGKEEGSALIDGGFFWRGHKTIVSASVL